MWPTLNTKFDEKALLSTDATGSAMQNQKVKTLSTQMQKMPYFMAACEIFRLIGKLIAKYTGELEVCECHQEILKKRGVSFKRKRQQLKAEIGCSFCIWQGRRLPWFIAVGYFQLQSDLQNATNIRVQTLLSAMPTEERGRYAECFESVRHDLRDIYSDKCKYLFRDPHVCIGAFYCTQGGSPDRSRQILKTIIEKVDRFVANRKILELDQNTRRLFLPGTPVRRQTDAYIAVTESNLESFPDLFIALQEYALVPGVGRKIERVHATIKKKRGQLFGVGLPYVSAVVREQQNLANLDRDPAFRDFCMAKWHSRHLLDELLCLRHTPDELKAMTQHAKVETVYQCSLASEYQDISGVKQRLGEHQASAARYLPEPPPKLPTPDKLACTYMKEAVFHKGLIYSAPRDLFEAARLSHYQEDVGSSLDLLRRLFNACMERDADLPMDGESRVYFKVMDTKPERRHVVLDLATKANTHMQVALCFIRFLDAGTQRLAVSLVESEDVLQRLDLRALIKNIERTVREVCVWQARSPIPIPMVRQLPPMLPAITLGPVIAPVVGNSSASQSSALVPLVDASTALAISTRDEIQTFVQSLVDKQVFAGQSSIDFESSNMNIHVLERLAAAGVVELSRDEFLETTVALRQDGFQWRVGFGIERPIPLCRFGRCEKSILKTCKLQLLIALTLDGWQQAENGEDLPPVQLAVAKYYHDLKLPVSYFAALVKRRDILGKGVAGIQHKQRDNYYRCLLRMDGEDLLPLLNGLEGDEPDDFFRKKLKDLEDEDSDDSSEEDPPPRPIVPLPDVAPPVPAPLVDIQYAGFERQVVTALDGSGECRVYFDHFTGGSNQRSWCSCTHHTGQNCIRWREVHRDKDTLESVCASMFAWSARGPGCTDRAAHMSVEVEQADVDRALPTIRCHYF